MKSTPIYVKPQLTSDAGTCRVNVMVGIRNDPGKTIDSITVQFQLPPCILSADLTSNHGTVNILTNKVPLFFFFYCDSSSIWCKLARSCIISRGKRWFCMSLLILFVIDNMRSLVRKIRIYMQHKNSLAVMNRPKDTPASCS